MRKGILATVMVVVALVVLSYVATTTSAGPAKIRSTSASAAAALGDPINYGPTSFVAGRESCKITGDVNATWTTDPDGTEHVRDGWFTCRVTSNDRRVAGGAVYTWNADRWHAEGDAGSMFQWGTMRITNPRGTWEGQYQGIFTSDSGDTVFMVLTGTGNYAGWSYYKWSYKTFGATWPTEGLIFPSGSGG